MYNNNSNNIKLMLVFLLALFIAGFGLLMFLTFLHPALPYELDVIDAGFKNLLLGLSGCLLLYAFWSYRISVQFFLKGHLKHMYSMLYILVSFIIPIIGLLWTLSFFAELFDSANSLIDWVSVCIILGIGIVLLFVLWSYKARKLSPKKAKRKLIAFTLFFIFLFAINIEKYTLMQTIALYGLLVTLTHFVDAILEQKVERRINAYLDSLREKKTSKRSKNIRGIIVGLQTSAYVCYSVAWTVLIYVLVEQTILNGSLDYLKLEWYHVYTALVLYAEQIYLYYLDRREWYTTYEQS